MAKKNITIKELAGILNVSISTVSKALNDSSEIGARTKMRVRETAELYNYQPNFIAKSLKNKSTKTIGVVVPNILNYFFVKILYGIEKEARRKGYKVVTCISHESYESEVNNVTTLTNGQVDGLLICPSEETQNKAQYNHIQQLLDSGIPVVTFDRTMDNLKCSRVISDDFEAAFNATNQLISQGSKTVALFTAHKGLSVMQERIKGFTKSMLDNNLYNEGNIFHFPLPADSELLIKNILVQTKKIDAVLTIDEILSVKTIKIAQQLGLSIPSEIKVIGFSNGEISKEYHPSISSVDQRAEDMGLTAAQLLIEKIENPDKLIEEVIVVKSILIHRESTLPIL